MTRRCCLASGFPPHHHALGCSGGSVMSLDPKPCTDNTPPWFVGHWREWHRGHGCDRDDGKPRAAVATTEIAQHTANTDTGFLTDAELNFLRASTTSGNTLLMRALDELCTRRMSDHGTRSTKHFEPLLGFCVCVHCVKLPEHAP